MTAVPARHIVLALTFLAAFVRLLHLSIILETPLAEYHRYFQQSDMYLFDQWAQRIVKGDVLGREIYHPLADWQLATAPPEKWAEWYGRSPIFYKAPLYPYLLAFLYWVFGQALIPVAVLQILASTLSVLLLFRIGERLFGPSAGFMAALFYALYAPAIHYDVIMLRGPWIVVTALLCTWQLLELRSRPGILRSGALGLSAGLGLLLNEGFLWLPPLIGLVLLGWFRLTRRLALLGVAFFLGFALALSPVVLRNLLVGVSPLKLAVTGGTVYCVFNSANASPHFFDVPRADLASLIARSGGDALAAVRVCIESFQGDLLGLLLFYIRKGSGLIVPFENPDNASFYYACLKSPLLRVLPDYSILFPLSAFGFALVVRRAERLAPLLPAAASLLLSIMITLPLSRYRATFAALLVPLAGVAAAQLGSWLKRRRLGRLAAAAVALLLAFFAARALQQRVVFGGKPSGLYLYRPVEFVLGSRIYERQGRYGRAAAELLELARLNPDAETRAGALLGAAWYQALAGRKEEVRRSLEKLLADHADDAKTLMAAGDSYRDLLHDKDRAVYCYRRAALLDPGDALGEALRKRREALQSPKAPELR